MADSRYYINVERPGRVLWCSQVGLNVKDRFWIDGPPTFFGLTKDRALAKARHWVKKVERREATKERVSV